MNKIFLPFILLAAGAYLLWPRPHLPKNPVQDIPVAHAITRSPSLAKVEPETPPARKSQPAPAAVKTPVIFEDLPTDLSAENRLDRFAKLYASPEYIKKLIDERASLQLPPLKPEQLKDHEVFGDTEISSYELGNGNTVEIADSGDSTSENVLSKTGDLLFHVTSHDGKVRSFLIEDSLRDPGGDGHPEIFYHGKVSHLVSLDENGQVERLISRFDKTSISQQFENGKTVYRRAVIGHEDEPSEVYDF